MTFVTTITTAGCVKKLAKCKIAQLEQEKLLYTQFCRETTFVANLLTFKSRISISILNLSSQYSCKKTGESPFGLLAVPFCENTALPSAFRSYLQIIYPKINSISYFSFSTEMILVIGHMNADIFGFN